MEVTALGRHSLVLIGTSWCQCVELGGCPDFAHHLVSSKTTEGEKTQWNWSLHCSTSSIRLGKHKVMKAGSRQTVGRVHDFLKGVVTSAEVFQQILMIFVLIQTKVNKDADWQKGKREWNKNTNGIRILSVTYRKPNQAISSSLIIMRDFQAICLPQLSWQNYKISPEDFFEKINIKCIFLSYFLMLLFFLFLLHSW